MGAPILYQISARDWLTRVRSTQEGLPTLRSIPDAELDALAGLGFDWLYLLGVWQTGEEGRRVSLSNRAWQPGYTRALSSFEDSAVAGSPFAVQRYAVHVDFGGDEALAELRRRLAARGVRLMLDFVPNHVAIDHHWTSTHPDRIIQGTEEDLAREPGNFVRYANRIFAHGRDPYFPGWIDTVQLDYSNADTRDAMAAELERISGQCDGVRCDMAMLVLPEVFERTWQRKTALFWPGAIAKARAANRGFVMMAEVYWGLEWELQQQGFDYTYDKTLYDRLLGQDAGAVRSHLVASVDFQKRMARFLENHDEPRIAEELPFDRHRAAAVVAYGLPGLRFFHDGQLEGAVRKPSIHLGWREREPADAQVNNFYCWLIPYLRGKFAGDWRLLEVVPAWAGNPTDGALIAYGWFRDGRLGSLVAVNFSSHQSQGFVRMGEEFGLAENTEFTDALTGMRYQRQRGALLERGLYVDLPAWGAHVLEV